MGFIKRLFQKTKSAPLALLHRVEEMYNHGLDAFDCEVVDVIYCDDKTRRYVFLEDENNFYTYQAEEIKQFDEETDDWKYIFDKTKHYHMAWFAPDELASGKSLFSSYEEALKQAKSEWYFKQYF